MGREEPNIGPERHAAQDDRRGEMSARRDSALSAIRVGHVYLEADSYVEAIECFRQAERGALDDALAPAELADLFTALAKCYVGLGKHDRAREYVRRVEHLGIRRDDEPAAAEAQVVLARIEIRSGRFRSALAAARRAYEALRGGPDTPLLASASKVLGTAHAELGDVVAARDCFMDCLVCNKRIGNEAGVAGAFNNLGILAKRTGDLLSAVEYFERALEIDERLGRSLAVARRLNNLGVAYYRMARWREAEAHLKRALKICVGLGATRDVVAVESALGSVYRARREWTAARQKFDRVLATSRTAGYRRAEALALEFLGELEKDQGHYDRALVMLDRALVLARGLSSTSDVVGEVLRRRAEVFLLTGRLEDAMLECRRALEVVRRIGDKLEEGAALRVLAGVLYAQGRRDAAHQAASLAEELLRSTGATYELALAALVDGVGLRDSAPADAVPVDQIEVRLATAEELFHRIGSDYWVGRCRLERARCLAKAGSLGRARSWAERARSPLEEARDEESLDELHALLSELDGELACAATATAVEYAVLAGGCRLLQTAGGIEALHRFATMVAEAVSADRVVLFSLEGGVPRVATSVGRTGRRLAEVKRFVRSWLDECGPSRPVVECGRRLAAAAEPPGLAAIALIPVGLDLGGQPRQYVLYADRLQASCPGAFSARDIEFIGAAARVLAVIHLDLLASPDAGTPPVGAPADTSLAADSGLITCDPKMLAILDHVERLADSSIPILIVGESGVGKEVLARAIHRAGRKRSGSFVALNSAAIPAHLQESELFGHVRGAFTDADRDREGLVAAAAGGTLFLDEIGEMSPDLQVKLLRFLEDGEYRRVGDSAVRRSDARVVSASNRDLREEVRRGRFRRDLYYRLSAYVVDIPPLRERRCDIPLLMDHFLEFYAKHEGKRVRGFSREVRELFLWHDWRGNNVRELENEVRRAVALCDHGGLIGIGDLRPELRARYEAMTESRREQREFDFLSLRDEVEALERCRIADALERSGNSKRKAAKYLGLSRTGLYTKMRKYGME